MSEAIAWDLATKVAARVAGRDPYASSYLYESLQPDFDELTAQAEELVTAATGLRPLTGPARARVTDRAGWVNANIASFRRLMAPLLNRFEARLAETQSTPLGRVVQPVGRVVTATQIGTLLGWMSTRVIGQYDLLLMEDDRPEDQDIVYYVGPNILGLEKRFAFPPREFRLWVAMNEVTHRAQFTGVPWMRAHFLSLVEQSVGATDPDPARFIEALKRAIDLARSGRNPLDDGLMALLATPEQAATLDQIQGLMSLLEGHGDITMDRAGADPDSFGGQVQPGPAPAPAAGQPAGEVVPTGHRPGCQAAAVRSRRALHRRSRGLGRDRVCSTGRREGPDRLPVLGEIREPVRWIDRMRKTPAGGWVPELGVSP